MQGFRWQVASQRLQQAEGEMVAAIGKLPLAFGGKAPVITGPARTLRRWTGLYQTIIFQATEMATHNLHRHLQMGG